MKLREPALDHLVVVARTLEEGVAWCEATLGITPGPGGEHPLFGTHNRLFSVGSAAFAGAYFEIIAINSIATKRHGTLAPRWFDMDSPVLQAQIGAQGPQLAHWVARVPDVAASVAAWCELGIDRGAVVAASRQTPQGLLRWQITVRGDGQRLMDGCLPTLIEWGEDPRIAGQCIHPTQAMPASGVRLEALHLRHPQAPLLSQALAQIGLPTPAGAPLQVAQGAAQLEAVLDTPKGRVHLRSLPTAA